MGFDIKRFRDCDVKEEFVCPICCDILEDPILLEDCEHVFCRQCIEQWLRKCEFKLCPIDRQDINNKPLRPPQRSFRNLILSLEMRCEFHSNGCLEYIRIEEMSVHSSQCHFNPIIMNQKIQCPALCGAIVKRCESLNDHNCVTHLQKIIDEKNDVIQKLCFENEKMLKDNHQMKSENNYLKNKYEESVEKLEQLTNENRDLSKELIEIKQKLNKSYETVNKVTENNVSKDKRIEELTSEIKIIKASVSELKKRIKTMTRVTRLSNVSNDNSNDCSEDLMSFGIDETDAQSDVSSDDSEDMPNTTSMENQKLVEALTKKGYLSNRKVIRAMLSIDRGLFASSAASYALHHCRPIGHGAHTGSATYEAIVLHHLETHLTKDCKVLDIGTGSGYLVSCIASMVGPKAKVIGIDHIPQLVVQSIATIDKHYSYLRSSGVLKLYASDGRFGCSSDAPFDLIFIEPLTRRVPQKLIDQLRPGGCIVVPIGTRDKDITLELFTKQSNGEMVRQSLCEDWKLMQENCPDSLEDKKLQLRSGWKVKLGF